jgi:hypothetical protein
MTRPAISIDEGLRHRIESTVCAAHNRVYLVSFLERHYPSGQARHTVRVHVFFYVMLGGQRFQIWLGLFDALSEMPVADLADLVRTKIAKRESKP